MADPQGDPRDQHEQQNRRPTAEVIPPGSDFDVEAMRSLGELAVTPELTVVQERGLFGDLITAQPLKKYRDASKILKEIDVWAAIAGPRWFYRYPVRNRKTGRTDYIEGPSVKCTNAVARLFGNCSIESRTMKLDDKTYICYSRFGDLETGFSMTKGQLVPRSATLGGDDEERRVAIAHNIGQSKSQRNVTDAALGDYTQRGFAAAKGSIVERIGKNVEKARERIAELLVELGRDKSVPNLIARVEYVTGRRLGEWLAPDIAGIHAELEAVREGFASIDEQWPLQAPAEPRRGNGNETTAEAATPAAHSPAAAASTAAAAPSDSLPKDPTPGSASPPSDSVNENPAPAATPVAGDGQEGSGPTSQPTPPPEGEQPMPRNWTVPADTLGQENIIRILGELLDETTSDEEQDEFERQNAERISKITGERGRQLKNKFDAKRRARRA